MQYLGVDIGGTAVKLGIVDECGHISAEETYSVSFDHYQTPIIETVLTSIDRFLSENQIRLDTLSGIGVSATGQIDTQRGVVAGSGGNLKGWENTPIKALLEEKYSLKTTVVNDANCVAIGEKWIGSAKDASNALILTIGTGLGGGIIVDNEILLGKSGFGGEIGHFSIDYHGRDCTCGNKGCFEQYASMTALVKDIKTFYEKANPDFLTGKDVNGKFIFSQITEGNADITNIVDTWIDTISRGIVSLVHIFNPEIVIIGGGVSLQEELFIKKLRAMVLQGLMPNFSKELKVEAAKLGNNAGLVGAVSYLIHH